MIVESVTPAVVESEAPEVLESVAPAVVESMATAVVESVAPAIVLSVSDVESIPFVVVLSGSADVVTSDDDINEYVDWIVLTVVDVLPCTLTMKACKMMIGNRIWTSLAKEIVP